MLQNKRLLQKLIPDELRGFIAINVSFPYGDDDFRPFITFDFINNAKSKSEIDELMTRIESTLQKIESFKNTNAKK